MDRQEYNALKQQIVKAQIDGDTIARRLREERVRRAFGTGQRGFVEIDADLRRLGEQEATIKALAVKLRRLGEREGHVCAVCARYGFDCDHVATPATFAYADGGAIKSLTIGDGVAAVGGYLVRYGTLASPGDLSEARDIFRPPPETSYGPRRQVDALVHHGKLPSFGAQKLTRQAELVFDRVGIFVRHLLDLRDEYETALADLVKRGKLAWSSGADRRTVVRKALAGGRHLILNWEIIEASYTPQPAEPQNMVVLL